MFGQAVILIKPNNDFSAFFCGGTGFVLHKDCGEELTYSTVAYYSLNKKPTVYWSGLL